MKCWILTERDKKGTLNPCLGLAEAMNISRPEIKYVGLKEPWRFFAPYLNLFSPYQLSKGSSHIDVRKMPSHEHPDVIIASGRKAILPALWLKRKLRDQCKVIFIQNPKAHHKYFDLIIAPEHDNVKTPNSIVTHIGLTHVNQAKLKSGYKEFQHMIETRPAPRIGVLLGGSSKHHIFTDKIITQLIHDLKTLADDGYGILITASRRTPSHHVIKIRAELAAHRHIYLWDGQGDNPYFGILGGADILLVSEDSISMMSEAVTTGKPTYILPMHGESKRHQKYCQNLIERGFAKKFDGQVEKWQPKPHDEMTAIIDSIKAL